MNEVYLNLLKAGMTIIFVVMIDVIFEFLIKRKIKDKKKSFKWRVATRYVLFFCLLFFMAKIWVEGFGYLLTVIGVVSAALTITQKEYLMNFFGWLIIMWRDLFVEGDYIEVGKYIGYVKKIGPLYFSMEEGSEVCWGDKTGRIVKVPNSLIATNPVVNFSVDKTFFEGKILLTFSFKSPIEKLQALISTLENEIDVLLHQQQAHWSQRQQKEFNNLKKHSLYKPKFSLRVNQDRPLGIQLRIKYLALKQDQKLIEDAVFNRVMSTLQADPELELSHLS
ncbi:MAG: hypothetical protein BGO43_08275 [Gammaproteobacteria bacterium 39-13]|nr:mechanosensitive ion channel [Gammaproteobacteria bacterium]OJV91667.1 MAG: hypothetical protein BGO43_08275 [Gammaproteobacteria bacterium 39-13]